MKRKPIKIKTKYSQKTISDTVGVTQPTISGWLHLKYQPVGLARKELKKHFPQLLKDIDNGFAKKS